MLAPSTAPAIIAYNKKEATSERGSFAGAGVFAVHLADPAEEAAERVNSAQLAAVQADANRREQKGIQPQKPGNAKVGHEPIGSKNGDIEQERQSPASSINDLHF